MKADILSLSQFAYLAEIGTLIFMAVFLGALYRVLRPGAKQNYAAHARMPLDDDNPVEPLDR
jgi:cbb3-type cytochrome oxidase subunit 3